MTPCIRRLGLAIALPAMAAGVSAQDGEPLPQALAQILEAERALAARTAEAGWKAAMLEYLAGDAVGFAQGAAALARDQVRRLPDLPGDEPPVREPATGDVAASRELGYVTGSVRHVPSLDGGETADGIYTSIWKRQRDGTFRIVLNVVVETPRRPPPAAEFTRAAAGTRFSGDYDETTPPLAAADGVLNSGLRTSPARAYTGQLAGGATFLRPGLMPVAGVQRISRWLESQRSFAAADTRFTEASRSGDLGYTWGTYQVDRRGAPRQEGFYVRVWVRERSGQWKIAVDVLQPQV